MADYPRTRDSATLMNLFVHGKQIMTLMDSAMAMDGKRKVRRKRKH